MTAHQRSSGREKIPSAEGQHSTQRRSKRRSEALPILRPTRAHRKERIVIADSPHTSFGTTPPPSSPSGDKHFLTPNLPTTIKRPDDALLDLESLKTPVHGAMGSDGANKERIKASVTGEKDPTVASSI
jgi:hypothetical protein